MKKTLFYIAIPLLFLTSCIYKATLRPEIEGRVFNSDTKKPEKDIIVEIELGRHFGGAHTIEESSPSDSLGYYKIKKIEKFQLLFPSVESTQRILCLDCPLVLKKEGYQNDTLTLEHHTVKNNDDTYKSFTVDSLFFTARPIE